MRFALCPASTRNLLDTIANEIGSKMLSEVDCAWAENWIRALKREKHIAPGTIRKKKGALSRVFDWLAVLARKLNGPHRLRAR